MPPEAAAGMSVFVFAGSAQFLALPLIEGGVPIGIIWLTTLVINLRHALYGVSLSSHFNKLSIPWKMLLAYLMVDESYAMYITNVGQENHDSHPSPEPLRAEDRVVNHRHWFYLGSGLILWCTWQVSTLIGIFFGAYIPQSWGLDFALPLTFIALVMPALTQKADVVAALLAGIAALALSVLPLKLGLVAAALIGISAGVFVAQAEAK